MANPSGREDVQDLFDEIYELVEKCSWFDTSIYVDSVHAQYEDKNFVSDAQYAALEKIRDMLKEKGCE